MTSYNRYANGIASITTVARRITRTVNSNYGTVYALYFDAQGFLVAHRFSPEEFGPKDSEYTHKVIVSLLGAQPQKWTYRMVQDVLDSE